VQGRKAEVVKGIFHGKPRLVSWNITLRCPLACAHCYVDAGGREAEGVLSTREAFGVIGQLCEAGRPVVVLSGGEPLLRDDIFEIARYGTDQGLRMVMGSSGVLIDRAAAARLSEAGIHAVAISLDSADPTEHDSFRGIPGVWEKAVQAIRYCLDEGMGVQINTSVIRWDIDSVNRVIALGRSLGVRDYQVFFPVPSGRGRDVSPRSPGDYESLIAEILLGSRTKGINVRPTCAPQFRRIADTLGIVNPTWGRGCIAGISYCRVYANGDVTPCPYLPVSAGNVRDTDFTEIWQRSEIFKALRDPAKLSGKCGCCKYKAVCGGCRARAYRGTGALSTGWCDGLAMPESLCGEICGEDPFCPYEPGEDT